MRLSLAALLFLLATAPALYSWDQKKLRDDTDVRLDTCIDNLGPGPC